MKQFSSYALMKNEECAIVYIFGGEHVIRAESVEEVKQMLGKKYANHAEAFKRIPGCSRCDLAVEAFEFGG